MTIETREARPDDIAALLVLDEIARTEPGRTDFVREVVGGGGCLVAEQGADVVGYGVLQHKFFGQGFVSLVYVGRPWRRHGVGGALLRALAERCETPKLFTSTNVSNLPMQALLAKAGFEISGIVHNLDPGDPELVYVRFLADRGG